MRARNAGRAVTGQRSRHQVCPSLQSAYLRHSKRQFRMQIRSLVGHSQFVKPRS